MGKPRRRSVAPAPAIAWLPGSTEVPVVGETFRADAIRAVAKRLQPADEVRAWLVPEPHNPHDRHAVAVHLEGVHAGYLPRQVAAAVQPVLLAFSARHNGQLVACPARVHSWHVGPHAATTTEGPSPAQVRRPRAVCALPVQPGRRRARPAVRLGASPTARIRRPGPEPSNWALMPISRNRRLLSPTSLVLPLRPDHDSNAGPTA
jgi:hypothetical protein